MGTYAVTVSIIGTAVIEVEAKNKNEAQSIIEEIDIEEIVNSASFDDGIEIVEVEKT